MQLKYTLKEELTSENIDSMMECFTVTGRTAGKELRGKSILTIRSVIILGLAQDKKLVRDYINAHAGKNSSINMYNETRKEYRRDLLRLVYKISKAPFDIEHSKWLAFYLDECTSFHKIDYETLEKVLDGGL